MSTHFDERWAMKNAHPLADTTEDFPFDQVCDDLDGREPRESLGAQEALRRVLQWLVTMPKERWMNRQRRIRIVAVRSYAMAMVLGMTEETSIKKLRATLKCDWHEVNRAVTETRRLIYGPRARIRRRAGTAEGGKSSPGSR